MLPSPAGPGSGCRSSPHPPPHPAPGVGYRALARGTGLCTCTEQHEAVPVVLSVGIFSFRDASKKEAAAVPQAVSELERAPKVSIVGAWLYGWLGPDEEGICACSFRQLVPGAGLCAALVCCFTVESVSYAGSLVPQCMFSLRGP